MVLDEGARAAQVAQALLADGGGEQDGVLRRVVARGEPAREFEHRRQAEAVVAYARAVQRVRGAPRLERRAGREDRVEVGGDDRRRAVSGPEAGEDVAGAVASRPRARLGEPLGNRPRAPVLVARRSGDRAEREGVRDDALDRVAQPCRLTFLRSTTKISVSLGAMSGGWP